MNFNLDLLAVPSESRGGGKTTSKLVQVFSYIDFNPNQNILFVVDNVDFTLHYAIGVLEKMNFIRNKDFFVTKRNAKIKFSNNSTVTFSRNETQRGIKINLIEYDTF